MDGWMKYQKLDAQSTAIAITIAITITITIATIHPAYRLDV
jgi:hypothetical protein